MKTQLSLFIVSLLLCNSTAHATITLVTDSAHPLQNIPDNARVINLDESLSLHQALSDNLSHDPELSARWVKARITALGPSYQQNIQQALQDALDAYQLGVTKIPAVIQDNRYVVYGDQNVAIALQLIAQQRGHDEP